MFYFQLKREYILSDGPSVRSQPYYREKISSRRQRDEVVGIPYLERTQRVLLTISRSVV